MSQSHLPAPHRQPLATSGVNHSAPPLESRVEPLPEYSTLFSLPVPVDDHLELLKLKERLRHEEAEAAKLRDRLHSRSPSPLRRLSAAQRGAAVGSLFEMKPVAMCNREPHLHRDNSVSTLSQPEIVPADFVEQELMLRQQAPVVQLGPAEQLVGEGLITRPMCPSKSDEFVVSPPCAFTTASTPVSSAVKQPTPSRHQAVVDRTCWLYLKGRLEGFELLQPESVFPQHYNAPIDCVVSLRDPPALLHLREVPSTSADVGNSAQRQQLEKLYHELQRRGSAKLREGSEQTTSEQLASLPSKSLYKEARANEVDSLGEAKTLHNRLIDYREAADDTDGDVLVKQPSSDTLQNALVGKLFQKVQRVSRDSSPDSTSQHIHL